ncbi:hypothetical protein [Streptomyces sp. NPDC092307]|uniref:hypothetical protein n=1 Tax=Streptomyces sp. NPDC092307 TaxID=3366013 RepID=UPI003826D4AC
MRIGDDRCGEGEHLGGRLARVLKKRASRCPRAVSRALRSGPAVGGPGHLDCNGDVILPDGEHGHLCFGFIPPRERRGGALHIEIENRASGPCRPAGAGRFWRGAECTDAVSPFEGNGQDRIGEGRTSMSRALTPCAEGGGCPS